MPVWYNENEAIFLAYEYEDEDALILDTRRKFNSAHIHNRRNPNFS